MTWNGNTIVDVSRDFLNTNGCSKHVDAEVGALPSPSISCAPEGDSDKGKAAEPRLPTLEHLLSSAVWSERFDGYHRRRLGIHALRRQVPADPDAGHGRYHAGAERSDARPASVMAFGFDPYFTEQNPYHGASAAVIESVSKLVAAGCDFETAYLTFQEYFEQSGQGPEALGQAAVRPARRVHRAG